MKSVSIDLKARRCQNLIKRFSDNLSKIFIKNYDLCCIKFENTKETTLSKKKGTRKGKQYEKSSRVWKS